MADTVEVLDHNVRFSGEVINGLSCSNTVTDSFCSNGADHISYGVIGYQIKTSMQKWNLLIKTCLCRNVVNGR